MILPLTIEGATVRRHGKLLVGPVDLTLGGRGVTMVIGPNGAGKTSLLRMMHGLERLTVGRMQWGVPIAEARRHQSFVFQTPVMMRRSVRESLAYPLRLLGVPRQETYARAEYWAERVGLGEALGRPSMVLSGGERQKLALARALIREPELLFLDEPCASLDGRATREIEGILNAAVADGTRIVMSTHDMGQARRLGDEVVFMLHGRVHEMARVDAFFERPNTTEARGFIRGEIVE